MVAQELEDRANFLLRQVKAIEAANLRRSSGESSSPRVSPRNKTSNEPETALRPPETESHDDVISRIRQNAELKQRKLQLQVLYLEKELAASHAETKRLEAENMILRQKGDSTIESERNLKVEEHINDLLRSRDKLAEENFLLKKKVMKCNECSGRQSSRKEKSNASSPSLCSLNDNEVPFASPQRPTWQTAAKQLVRDLPKLAKSPRHSL